jgi:hypothetical protein
MIRGTIEQSRHDLISGWMYCAEADVRGRLVLAFLDEVCVGAGRIEAYRSDLEAAGLADGCLGFSFPIEVPDADDPARVTVKIEGSDVVLIQRGARVVFAEVEEAGPMSKDQADALLPSYKWMLSRGWLTQSDYDYLKALLQFGIYERTLVTGAHSGEVQLGDARKLSTDLLSLLSQGNVDLIEQRPPTLAAFDAVIQELRDRPGRPALSLWSADRSLLRVFEGSHFGGVDPDAVRGAAVNMPLDPERLVILDAHCKVEFVDYPTGGVRLFVPQAPLV